MMRVRQWKWDHYDELVQADWVYCSVCDELFDPDEWYPDDWEAPICRECEAEADNDGKEEE